MKVSTLYFLLGGAALTISSAANSAVSTYLPLKMNAAFELEIDRLVTISGYPGLKKPYHVATISTYLDTVKDSHPALYSRISRYIKPYQQTASVTQLKASLRLSDSTEKTLPNSRGVTTDSLFTLQGSAFWQPNEYFIANAGGAYTEKENFIPYGNFFSFGGRYLQIDVGYREHWLTSLRGSSQIISTQAEPMLSFTLSNVEPITDFNIMYELGFGKLKEVEGIVFDDTLSSGKPGFLTMHASIQLLSWWTISGNRTMQFSGGNRGRVTGSDIWQAMIDPVKADNCGGQSELTDCDKEFGNQQAAITSRMDLNWGGKAFSLSIEVAGEDTNDYKAYKLGNKAYSIEVFIPYLSAKESLTVTGQYIEDAWYVHHLYKQGYSNEGHKMGHWWGDEKGFNDGIGAKIFSVAYTKDLASSGQFRAEYHTIKNEYSESLNTPNYQRGHYLKLDYEWLYSDDVWGMHLYAGKDVDGESFNTIAISKQW